MKNKQENGLYSIGAISSMTGVNAVTLRAWERRYGLIQPQRTETGHRLYSDKDLEAIQEVLSLLDQGISISRIKNALETTSDSKEARPSHWVTYSKDLQTGVNNFDEQVLNQVYNEAMSLYPVDVVTRELIIPFMKKLGQRWEKVSTGIAEEHFFTSFMRNKLGARFHHRNQQNSGPQIIAACLPGETHEFGLLLLSLALHARNYRIIMLGADIPIEQLSEVRYRTIASGLVLSGATKIKEEKTFQQLTELVNEIDVPVCIGGVVSDEMKNEINATGAHAVGSELIEGLNKITQLIDFEE